jgi:autotransporter-associated beta strand protein
VLSGGEELDNDDGGSNNLTLTGLISETGGSGSIVWCTPGILTLTNPNTFTGGVDMREGTLLLGSDSAAGSGPITLDSGTTLSAYGTNNVRTLTNAIDFTGSSAQLGNNDDNNLTLNGLLSGSGAVTYAGGSTGHLTLNGSNTEFSPSSFTVSSGNVIVGSSNALGSAGSVNLTGGAALTVESGVTISNALSFTGGSANVLSGNGTVASPAFTANSAVVLSPSGNTSVNSPGDLSFTNTLTIASGSAIHFEIDNATGTAGTDFSLISANGGLDLTAAPNTITFNIVSSDSSGNAAAIANFNAATPYSWMFATSATPIVGFNSVSSQFNLVTSGFLNPTSGGTFSVTESGDNLFLNFTPVPEPSTWCLMGAGLLAVVGFSLRRRRAALSQKP